MRIDLIAPDPHLFVSGGNIYNAGLARGLRTNGADVFISDKPNNAKPPDFSLIDTIYFDRLGQNAIPGKMIGLIHHLESLYPLSAGIFESVDRPLLDRMDGYIATSEWTANFLARKGYQPDRIHVAEPVASDIRKKMDRPVTKVKALMLNNLVERKGVLSFLKHLAKLQLPGYYELRIIGSMSADRAYARACIEFVRTDKTLTKTVQFLGIQDDTAVEMLMDRSNLFISASQMETFGMSIQEAALCGLPLLVHEGGNAGNHVSTGRNGWKAPDMPALVHIFETLVNEPALLNRMAQKAISFQPSYPMSWDDSAMAIMTFLKSLA